MPLSLINLLSTKLSPSCSNSLVSFHSTLNCVLFLTPPSLRLRFEVGYSFLGGVMNKVNSPFYITNDCMTEYNSSNVSLIDEVNSNFTSLFITTEIWIVFLEFFMFCKFSSSIIRLDLNLL